MRSSAQSRAFKTSGAIGLLGLALLSADVSAGSRAGLPEASDLPEAVQQYLDARRQAKKIARESTAGSAKPATNTRGSTPVIKVGGSTDPACDFQATPSNNGLQQAIDAAASDSNGGDLTEIRLSRDAWFRNRTYEINDAAGGDQTVTLIGGFDDCSSTKPAGRTDIDLGGVAGPAFQITEAAALETVRFENLFISNATSTTSEGGALFIGDNNFVILANNELWFNEAGRGGAIYIEGSSANLWMLGSNTIRQNSAATEGGAIWCRSAESVVLDTQTLISDNEAELGGGIYARSGCNIQSYASEPDGIVSNSASLDGGGVYLDGPGDTFSLFGGENSGFGFGDASAPARIDSNSAGRSGGGIFASGTSTQVNLFDAHLKGNSADTEKSDTFNGQGGAIRLFAGASLTVDRTLDAVDCHSPIRCSEISGNSAPLGPAISSSSGGNSIDIRQTFITSNFVSDTASGPASLIEINGIAANSGVNVRFEGNVIAGNRPQGRPLDTIRLNNVETATVGFTTITDNRIGGSGSIFRIEGKSDISVFSSILHESFGEVFKAVWDADTTGEMRCANVSESGSRPPGSMFWTVADPELDVDYSVTPTSPGLDFCNSGTYTPLETDIASVARGLDLSLVTNFLGPFDLGAYEYPTQIQPGSVALAAGVIEVFENDGIVTFDVERSGGAAGEIRIGYATQDGSATGGDDYQSLNDELVWADGESGVKPIQLTLSDDALVEGTETLTLSLSVESGLAEIGSPGSVSITIFDDETTLFADGFEG